MNTPLSLPPRRIRAQSGFTMIEVLITLIVLALGLIGVIGLQARTPAGRARVVSARPGARAAAGHGGQDQHASCSPPAASELRHVVAGRRRRRADRLLGLTRRNRTTDLCDWGNELNGAAESTTGGTCVHHVERRQVHRRDAGRSRLRHVRQHDRAHRQHGRRAVAGPASTRSRSRGRASRAAAAPPSNLTCGQNLYPAGSTANDAYRRVVMATLRIGDLNSP